MGDMALVEEIEHKLTVPNGFRLPPLVGVGAVTRTVREAPLDLSADYYDTDDLRLVRDRITLRRRTGGTDDGWHLKVPGASARAGSDLSRNEYQLPLSTPGLPPLRFVNTVLGYTRGASLGHVATVHNRRSATALFNVDGTRIGEVADDRVTIERDGAVERFREVEVELAAGVAPATLRPIVEALVAAGARHSGFGSKAARAMGPAANHPPDAGRTPHVRADSSLTVLVRAQLVPAVSELQRADLALRLGAIGAPQRLRTALDDLLSRLAQVARHLSATPLAALRSECLGLAQLLAAADTVDGHDDLLRAMHLGRYLTLLDMLVTSAASPPLRRVHDETGR